MLGTILYCLANVQQSSLQKLNFHSVLRLLHYLLILVLLMCEQLNDYHLIMIIPVFSILFLSLNLKAICSEGQYYYYCFTGKAEVK